MLFTKIVSSYIHLYFAKNLHKYIWKKRYFEFFLHAEALHFSIFFHAQRGCDSFRKTTDKYMLAIIYFWGSCFLVSVNKGIWNLRRNIGKSALQSVCLFCFIPLDINFMMSGFFVVCFVYCCNCSILISVLHIIGTEWIFKENWKLVILIVKRIYMYIYTSISKVR